MVVFFGPLIFIYLVFRFSSNVSDSGAIFGTMWTHCAVIIDVALSWNLFFCKKIQAGAFTYLGIFIDGVRFKTPSKNIKVNNLLFL